MDQHGAHGFWHRIHVFGSNLAPFADVRLSHWLMLIVRRKAPVSGVFFFLYPWMSAKGEKLMFRFELFAILFGWFLPRSLMLHAPLLTFLVLFWCVRVGLVWFYFACFSDFLSLSWLYLSACSRPSCKLRTKRQHKKTQEVSSSCDMAWSQAFQKNDSINKNPTELTCSNVLTATYSQYYTIGKSIQDLYK